MAKRQHGYDSLNPFNWIRSAQDWVRTTEKSSGFRPFIIVLVLLFGFLLCLLAGFGKDVIPFVQNIVYIALTVFFLTFIIKSLFDPAFCRSERHVEKLNQQQIEMGRKDQPQLPVTDVIDAELVKDDTMAPQLFSSDHTVSPVVLEASPTLLESPTTDAESSVKKDAK